jgi:N-acetylglucosamine-6-phosphate deacetylase
MTLFINGDIITDKGLLKKGAIRINQGKIIEVDLEKKLLGNKKSEEIIDLNNNIVVAGFIDTQVNGGGGLIFNHAPTVETIKTIAKSHRRYGTTGFLPTLLSDDYDIIKQGIAAVEEGLSLGIPGLLGIHIEGPFLNSRRKGIHKESFIRTLDNEGFDIITSLKHGVTLVTLAPELTSSLFIQNLVKAGVIVSAGHTDANYDEMTQALSDGITGITHLFNATSALVNRAPGVVGAALDNQSAYCGIIVDGQHVNPVNLRIALRCRPYDRFMLVTDSMSAVGTTLESFDLFGKKIIVKGNYCVDQNGTLAGSNLTMAEALRNTISLLKLDITQASKMASSSPAHFLNISHREGRIRPGLRANFNILDRNLNVLSSWIDGIKSDATA